ncbi:MAG TPA: DUF1003 domain-containing protein [Aestuariivirga sp.]
MSTKPKKTLKLPPSIDELIKLRVPLRNVSKTVEANTSALDKLALWITSHVGTMGFFIVIFVWTVLWLGWNLLAPKELQFDPPSAFVFWLFISNLIQLMLMPLIMVGQNILGREADARAEHDLEVNIKAEREIEAVLRHLEYQNSILIAMLDKLGINFGAELRKTKK